MTAVAADLRVSADPLAAARALAPEIARRAREAEVARRLPTDLVRRMRAQGLFAMALPGTLGGLECEPGVLVDVVEEVSRADPAAGWTLLIGNTSAFLAWLDPDVAAEIVRRTPRPVVAGSMAPLGRGELTAAGDYRLTGRWPFASACDHADWVMGGFVVTEGGEPLRTPGGAPRMRVAFLARPAVEILDTWHVAGLAGTGSHDVAATDRLVPAQYTSVPFAEPARHGGPLYRLSPYNVLMVLLAGFPLGVARRALDELVTLAGQKVRTGGTARMIEEPAIGTGVLAAEAALAAAGHGIRAAIDDVWQTVRRGDDLTLRQRATLAAATINAFDVGRDVVSMAFDAAGASAVFEHSPLQRCLRDLHAAGQHIAFSADSRQRVARAFLGLPVPPAIFQV
jgi:alkylation response protein AidB-like acyl-CoA dehydrogenase